MRWWLLFLFLYCSIIIFFCPYLGENSLDVKVKLWGKVTLDFKTKPFGIPCWIQILLKIISITAQFLVKPFLHSLADSSIDLCLFFCVCLYVMTSYNILIKSLCILKQNFSRLYVYSSYVEKKRKSVVLLDTYVQLNRQMQCNLREKES